MDGERLGVGVHGCIAFRKNPCGYKKETTHGCAHCASMGGATVALMQGIIVFLLTLIIGFRPQNWTLLPTGILFVLIVALLFTALGTAIACVLQDMHGFQLIMNFLVMPVFLLSGALFQLTNLPKAMEIASKLDPLSYGIDGLRGVLIGHSTFGMVNDILVLGILTIILLGIGSYLFDKIQV